MFLLDLYTAGILHLYINGGGKKKSFTEQDSENEPLRTRIITSLHTSSSVYVCMKADDLIILLAKDKEKKKQKTLPRY